MRRLRERLAEDPRAAGELDIRLSHAGWSDRAEPPIPAVRLVAIERFAVDEGFPCLTRRIVPSGVVEASYTIRLPARRRA